MAGAETRSDILASLAAGFYGFISKHESDNRILSGIKDMLSGRIHVPMTLAATKEMVSDGDGRDVVSSNADILRLTARQREVLSLISRGLSNKEIGSALHITEATTKIHTATLLRALGVRNRTEAAFKAANLINIIKELDLRMDDTQTPAHDNAQIHKLRPTNGG
jgi:DNA-binding NarL/FixJ family response regulator